MHRLAITALFLCACGGVTVVEDGGVDVDAGVTEDSGTSPDASTPDAGPADSGTPDAGTPDAGPRDSGTVTADAGDLRPVLYPGGQTHSPLTDAVAANLRAIAARRTARERALSKVGDSQTVSPSFLNCFAGANITLGANAPLQPTLDAFRDGGTFARVSLAATVGWSAFSALAGAPSPLTQELAANDPRYAVVMFGSNDTQLMNLDRYASDLFAITDQLIDAGVVPLLTAFPPRDDSAAADAVVPRYNAVVRGIAQARQVPFIDLHRELLPLPSHGLGPDQLHLNASPTGACRLDAAGLQYGQNTRNALTLQALARARGALLSSPAPDATAPHLQGSGTAADPFVIPSLPFADLRDTRREGTNVISTYPGCAAAQDESGPELYYRLTLPTAMNLRAAVVSLGTADIDVHLLSPGLTGADCVARNDKTVARSGATGTLHLALDTFASGGVPQRGEYLLVVVAD